VDKCRSIGVAINQEANSKAPDGEATMTDISRKPGQKPAVLVCQTNEEVRSVLSFLPVHASDLPGLVLTVLRHTIQYEMAYQCVNNPL
jgi:acetate kinase